MSEQLPIYKQDEIFEDRGGESVGSQFVGIAPLTPPDSSLQLTTGTIAARFNVKTGPDLVLAAATHLVLIKGKQSFNRQQIIDEIKSASSYYKQSYLNNLRVRLKSI